MDGSSDTGLLEFYALPGRMTDAGPYTHLLDALPVGVPALVQVVQGLLLHIFWAEQHSEPLTEERKKEVNLRTVDRQLARIVELSDLPLTAARSPGRKLVGNCRSFSVLLTAFLRHQRVPSRARCGFGAYFLPDHYEDHWLCEYWNAHQRRWVLVDAQLDALQRKVLGIRFDPLDVPRDQFLVGGQAWQMCRAGQADPNAFGIFDMQGMWFIRGDLVRDFLALNKIELLPWDGWANIISMQDDLSPDETAWFDRLAALTLAGDGAYAEIRALCETDARLRPPSDWQPA